MTMADERVFRVVVAEDGSPRLRIQVFGDVDMLVAPGFLDSVLCAGMAGPGQVVVDLAGVTFMDSSGLGALIEAHRRLPALGCALVVSDPPHAVQRLIAITGLSDVLTIQGADDERGGPRTPLR